MPSTVHNKTPVFTDFCISVSNIFRLMIQLKFQKYDRIKENLSIDKGVYRYLERGKENVFRIKKYRNHESIYGNSRSS